MPTVLPRKLPRRATFHCAGGSVIHRSGSCFSNASIPASTNSAIAGAAAPRDEVSTRSPTESRGNPSTPAPSTWIHLMAGVSFRTSASWSVGNATSTSLEP